MFPRVVGFRLCLIWLEVYASIRASSTRPVVNLILNRMRRGSSALHNHLRSDAWMIGVTLHVQRELRGWSFLLWCPHVQVGGICAVLCGLSIGMETLSHIE